MASPVYPIWKPTWTTCFRTSDKICRPPIINLPFIGLIRLYQLWISPLLGSNCRFTPSCSVYALECFTIHVLPVAMAKSAWRILRCNPLIPGGFDPVRKTKGE